METDEFIVRSYGKSELAKLYFPGLHREAAVQKLNRWIRKCTCLYNELTQKEYAYQPTMKTFTAREVRLITYYLGEPFRVPEKTP